MIEATAIGAVQACYVLFGLEFVISTRTVLTVNSLPHCKLPNQLITDRLHILTMDDEECTISQGINSQLGQRVAYNKLIIKQYSTNFSCFLTYYIMLTYYSLSICQATGKQQVTAPTYDGYNIGCTN